LIEKAMKRSVGNRTKAAGLLGITPQALSQYLRTRK
jgi:predicted transcriptional regulator